MLLHTIIKARVVNCITCPNKPELCTSFASKDCMTDTLGCYVLLQEAFAYYKRGISLPEARFHVGRCYDHGIGTAQNKVLALKWYKQARQQSISSNSIPL